MNGLDGREVRYFVAVAEELHFGLAAERLRVAQPAVLRTIAALERRLGAGLLDRSTRHVALTPAGEVLLGHARVALDALAAAERLTVRAARRPSELVVAVKPDGDGALLGPLVAVYEAEPGAPPARSLLVRLAELTACVRDGRADVALVPRPFDARGLRWEEVLREPRVVALPADHPLATADEVTVQDLGAEPFVRWADVDPDVERLRLAHERAGPLVHDLAEALDVIELGRAVTLLPRSVAERFPNRAIAYRPVSDLSPARLAVVWRESNASPAVAAFVRATRALGAARETLAT
jgi:DNA-binding transcriptional LysR family regulator